MGERQLDVKKAGVFGEEKIGEEKELKDTIWDKILDFFYFADYYILMVGLAILFIWLALK